MGKHVGAQYLDNTSASTRKMKAFTTFNFQMDYTFKEVFFKEITIGVLVNNIFNQKYAANGYTWGYIYGGERTDENFYYPQAGTNFLARLVFKL